MKKAEVLLWPLKTGVQSARRFGGMALEMAGFSATISSSDKDRHVHIETLQTLDSVTYAAHVIDPMFLDLSLRKVPNVMELERTTAIKIVAQGVAKSYIRDAGRRQDQEPDMNEDRKLAFKRLLSEHLQDGETFESIGVDETLLPTLRTYHPEFADPPQLAFPVDTYLGADRPISE